MFMEIMIEQNEIKISKNKKYLSGFYKISLRWPGVEPGSTAWKAAMLTAIPPTLVVKEMFL